jgi:PPK2 family polyphosphate:nucleotide phosphotransferase
MQDAMMAEQKKGILVVLQGMDASGKDGTVKKVFSGINPSGINVHSFKVPTEEEFAHDFLWRIHSKVPGKGKIGVFNRSHYEDILVPYVHNLANDQILEKRLIDINNFESLLRNNNIIVLKFYLHISQDEQRRRFTKRMKNQKKFWKFSKKDIHESKLWAKYMEAYEIIFKKCPGWNIIPSDNKHYRNYMISKTICETMKKCNFQYPKTFKS